VSGPEYAGLFLLGLLGSTHCLGMCSGFVLCLSARREGRPGRLAAYQAGRGLGYATAGALLGTLGLAHRSSAWPLLVAALVMVVLGLGYLGLWPRPAGWHLPGAWLGPGLAAFLRRGSPWAALGLGLATGLLPCGLLYAALARAAAASGPVEGALVMLTFWAGTLPALVGVGVLGPWACRHQPGWWPRLAGAGAVLAGLLTAWRAFLPPGSCH
jgi:sulfite exporter TauE/SafE